MNKSLCVVPGTPVAMAELTCSGGELDLQDCAWQAPDESCLTHEHDSVIYCTDAEATLTDGAVRLLAFDGSPSLTLNFGSVRTRLWNMYALKRASVFQCVAMSDAIAHAWLHIFC